jgi:M6 family metalloprotease-like protein
VHKLVLPGFTRAALLALVVALALLSTLGPAGAQSTPGPAAGARSATLTGTLDILHGDPAPAPGSRRRPAQQPSFRYFLTDERGQESELAIDGAVLERAGGAGALDGRRVTITLDAAPAAAAARRPRVQAIQLVGGPSTATLDPAEPDISGGQRFAFILCRFGDTPNDSEPSRARLQGMLVNARPGLDHYWRELSYGAINIANSQVFDWRNLPSPRSVYIPTVDGEEVADLTSMRNACISEHQSVDFSAFQGIVMVFNQRLDGHFDGNGYGTRRVLTLDGQTREWAVAWVGAPRADEVEHVAHEMGHGFGLPHSSGPYTQTYDSRWDVMSDGQECYFVNNPWQDPDDFPYGCVPTHTVAAHKHFLGWIPNFASGAPRTFTLPAGGRATLALARVAQPGPTGYLLARVPIPGSSTQFYSLEFRQKLGYDRGVPLDPPAATPASGAVVIHKVSTTSDDRNAQLVDVPNNGFTSDGGTEWLAGETFTDSANRITIRVDSINLDAGTATVTLDNRPSITIADLTVGEPSSPASSAQARFTVRLSHASSQAVGLDYVTAAGTATRDVDYVHVANHLSIPAGATTATIAVTVKFDTASEPNETFFVNLSNAIGATLADTQARATILNTLPSLPTPTPVPCPPPFVNCQEP